MKLQNTTQASHDQSLKDFNDEFQIFFSIVYLPMPAFIVSLALAAATLILGAVSGKAQMSYGEKDQTKRSLKSSDQQPTQFSRAIISNAQKVIKKLSCVLLPCYAASSLGGARVTLIMLIALYSKIMTLDDGELTISDIKRWKQLLEYRRWTLLSIVAQILLDFATNADLSRGVAYASGYLALIISIIALPPPFPSIIRESRIHGTHNQSASGSVVLSSGFETPSIPEVSSLRKSTISPLISSSEELNITLEAGVVSIILCVLLWFTSRLSADVLNPIYLIWFSITACTTAACLLLAQPQSLQENRGLGILVGAFTGSIITCLFHTDKWPTLTYQALLIGVSFLSMQIDTPTILASISKSSLRHNAHHHHSTSSSHAVHGQDHSWFTQFLLDIFQHRALLHSILVEKDSRRIFYFMRSVTGIISTAKRAYKILALILLSCLYNSSTASPPVRSDYSATVFICSLIVRRYLWASAQLS